MEAEQWTQVQDVLKHVCTEMATLQQACQGWEQRALNAEFQAAACQLEVICCELLPKLACPSFEFTIGLLGANFSFIAEDIYRCLIRHEKKKETQCSVYMKEFFTVINTVIGVLSKSVHHPTSPTTWALLSLVLLESREMNGV